ncbi:MAG: FAD-binding protein [Oscillospiraceae bacterium]|nr:FAD-binding protein [Oscillospiraceae bacterium]
MMEHIIYADLLVVGGGTAGTMAAIRAKECNPDAKVVIFDKSDIMYSGSIASGMDAFNVTAVPGFSTAEEYLETAHGALDGIVDDSQCYAWVSRTWDMVQRMEGWGVNFPKDKNGDYIVLNTAPKGRFCLAILEPGLKKILADKVHENGCTVYNRTMALDLIRKDGRVVGALGLNIRTGETIVCMAKAVILCAGGTARFGQTTNGYPYGTFDFPGNTGEAYRMAYRAGAKMTGFEYTIVDYSVKDANAAGLHISCTRGAYVLNAYDERIEESGLSICNMLATHNTGCGPLRVHMSHLPEEKIQEIEEILFTTERPMQKRFFEQRGVNFRQDDVEQWPSECFLCGGHGITGVMVNGKAESSIPGLYAAGDAANVRGFLPGALVMGEIAAESATQYAASMEQVPYAPAMLSERLAQIEQIKKLRGPVSVEEFESKLRRTITDYIVPPKNGYKLNRALQEIARFDRELKELVGIRCQEDLCKYFEVESILVSAYLSAQASMARKESRWNGWHYRTDYPEQDDTQWLKHIILEKGDSDYSVEITYQDVERMV